MADRKRSNGSNGRSTNGSRARSSTSSTLSARDAIESVREQLPDLMGKPVEAILGVERDDENQWRVTAQIVELARIPNSTDVLGVYAVTLEGDGELAGYRRIRRYNRSQADED